MSRLAAGAAHQFGGIELDRSKPLHFRLDGRRFDGFAGDTVLSAALANGLDTYGMLDGHPMGLTSRFAPPVTAHGLAPMPMDVAPAVDGLDYATVGARRRLPRFGTSSRRTLGHDLAQRGEPPWLRSAPEETLRADLLVVGGGVAGLAAAAAAASIGRKVILCERRAWFGGDARYYGAVGDDESPEAVTARLIAQLGADPNVTLLARTAVFAPGSSGARGLQVVAGERPYGRVIAIAADHVLIATGTAQRLPVFPGNRLPGVVPSIEAYHLAKRYGVARGDSALVSTQGNFGYRFALRFNDAGVTVRRIVDTRVNPQSRFVDFAKASGLRLAGGQTPGAVAIARHGIAVSWGDVADGAVGSTSEVAQLIVAGPLQPDLALWMAAGGGAQWNGDRLAATGHLDRVALAGSAAGYRSLAACLASGRSAAAVLFGDPAGAIDDAEIGAPFETPDAPVGISPLTAGVPTFLASGSSLTQRAASGIRQRELSAGDVAASVELGTISPDHAGALAEEHGAPGGDIVASSWAPAVRTADEVPPWLAARFGPDAVRRHLVVDGRRRFERGSLVYASTGPREPHHAIGVIIAESSPGGTALLLRRHAAVDRFIVVRLAGPSPARIAPEA